MAVPDATRAIYLCSCFAFVPDGERGTSKMFLFSIAFVWLDCTRNCCQVHGLRKDQAAARDGISDRSERCAQVRRRIHSWRNIPNVNISHGGQCVRHVSNDLGHLQVESERGSGRWLQSKASKVNQSSYAVSKSMEKICHFPVRKSLEKIFFGLLVWKKKIFSILDLLTYFFLRFYSRLT